MKVLSTGTAAIGLFLSALAFTGGGPVLAHNVTAVCASSYAPYNGEPGSGSWSVTSDGSPIASVSGLPSGASVASGLGTNQVQIQYYGTSISGTAHLQNGEPKPFSASGDCAPEPEDETISAKALTDHECNSTEWHFVITDMHNVDAPTSIHVVWANGNEEDVPLDKVTGNVAHYATTSNLDSTVTSATTSIDVSWDGQFNLSHGPCEESPEPEHEVALSSAVCIAEGEFAGWVIVNGSAVRAGDDDLYDTAQISVNGGEWIFGNWEDSATFWSAEYPGGANGDVITARLIHKTGPGEDDFDVVATSEGSLTVIGCPTTPTTTPTPTTAPAVTTSPPTSAPATTAPAVTTSPPTSAPATTAPAVTTVPPASTPTLPATR